MYIVYLIEFYENDKIYIGLSDNLNWQLELEKEFFKIEYNLEISNIKIITFKLSKKNAQIDKDVWIEKTKEHNINIKFNDEIPESFISKSLKNKETIKSETKKLEDNYMGLYYNYKTMKENSSQLNDIIERAIRESVEKWKDSEHKESISSNQDEYDEDGYDRYGYDYDGFDRTGLDRFGCDISGLDKDSYDKNGFDIYGFDREGFDDDGYDKYGYNRAHYESKNKKTRKLKVIKYYDDDGFDQFGYDRFGRTRDELGMRKK